MKKVDLNDVKGKTIELMEEDSKVTDLVRIVFTDGTSLVIETSEWVSDIYWEGGDM